MTRLPFGRPDVRFLPDNMTDRIAFHIGKSARRLVKLLEYMNRHRSQPVRIRPEIPSPARYAVCQVVGSKCSNIYHRPDCEWALEISAWNRRVFHSSGEAIREEYRACWICHP